GNKFIAVCVLAIKYGKAPPFVAGKTKALEFGSDPGGFVFFLPEFGDADFFPFFAISAQGFLWKVGTDGVLRNDVGGGAEDVGSGTIVFRKGDAERRRSVARLPIREALEEKLEAAEGSTAEAVDGLIVVADGEEVFTLSGQKLEQTELRDVRVL